MRINSSFMIFKNGFLFLLFSIFLCFISAAQNDGHTIILTKSNYNLLYKKIPNKVSLYIEPSKFNKSDSFNVTVSPPSQITKSGNNDYVVIPSPESDGLIYFQVWRNNVKIRETYEITHETPTPYINAFPGPGHRRPAFPYIDSIKCYMDLDWKTPYDLRVVSFQLVIRDTSGVKKYTQNVKGNKFSEEDKNNMKNVILKIKGDYLVDYIDVLVTDDIMYKLNFNQFRTNINNPAFRGASLD